MDIQQILAACDHTLLSQTATVKQIHDLCDDGIAFGCASVCVPSCYTAEAKRYTGGRIPVCTVIGFPNGNSTTASKVFEAADAVQNGADEIDMVINVGDVKNGDFNKITAEIAAMKQAVSPNILKVIIETCYLTDEEKVRLCRCVTEAEADFIKTSTGFGTAGATHDDIRLFKKNIGPDVKIKAAGGIRTIEDMKQYIEEGCSRIGASAAIKLLKDNTEADY